MISIENLTFQYNKTTYPALRKINLSVRSGEFILFTGQSGCGKTSLFRALNGLIPHFFGGEIEGTININGKNPFELGPRKMSVNVGTVFQNSENQLFMKHVDSEIAFGMENLGYSSEDMKSQIHQVAEKLGFPDLIDREITSLSGGEKQKVALASILVMGPDILLLDEPTSELDPLSAKELMNVLSGLNKHANKTILITEHRLERVLEYVDRLIIMEEGSILADSHPKNIFSSLESSELYSPPLIKFFQKLKKINPSVEIPINISEAKIILKNALQTMKISKNKSCNFLSKPNNPPIMEIKDIWFKYPTSASWILQNVSMKIYPQDFIAIVGLNGSGKTTLLKQMNGLLRPQKGLILYKDQDIKEKTIAQISRDVGYIFQNPSIQFYQDSLYDEFLFVLKNYSYNVEDRKKKKKKKEEEEDQNSLIHETLVQFNLSQYKDRYGRFLSIGEQQRAALATQLLLKPSILVLDEPTHGMDVKQKTEFMKYLNLYRKQGKAVVLVTHDVETVAKFAERVILISKGKIVEDGSTHSILSTQEPFIPQLNHVIKEFPEIPSWILTPKELLEVITQ